MAGRRSPKLMLVGGAVALVALAGGAALVVSARDGGRDGAPSGYAPRIEPSQFTTRIDNPFLPLAPGSRWVYEGRKGGRRERIVVEVTSETRRVMGVECVVVRDTVTTDGEVTEDTMDWYAQDRDGNVWYFGEDTKEYEGGKVVSTEGSWEAGVGGARPGIAMKARPQVGDRYRQEYLRGEAEDMAEVLNLSARAAVPFGVFNGVLQTKDFTPLEPDQIEHKYYASGVGLVLEVLAEGGSGRVELVEMTRG
jgi:hypothetical protein